LWDAFAADCAGDPVRFYAPPGPMLYLPQTADPQRAIPAAVSEGPRHGCAGIVVIQRPDQAGLAAELGKAGIRPHCDYYVGTL
jgi:hypothetical protein